MNLSFVFQGEPKAIQSVKFARMGNFVRTYQPKEVINFKQWLKLQAIQQLQGRKPLQGPLCLSVDFIFPPLKSWPKKKLEALKRGEMIWKDTKPDLLDNLCKGLDSLKGIAWGDDAQISWVKDNRKYYGFEPCIKLFVSELTETVEQGGLFK